MTPERWQQIKEIFDRAVECDSASQAKLLRDRCGTDEELLHQVEELLAADQPTDSRLQSPIDPHREDLHKEFARLLEPHDTTVTLHGSPSSQAPHTDPAARESRRLGDYEILRRLGRGGMGSVYLARRADGAFNKNVAIKVLRSDAASPDIIRRFHREREILAQLDQPNIARLLDAGETEDGLPYFVMEYVEGRTITDYADEQRLPLPERIALFRQMCDAVEYAHQHRVVHRDLSSETCW
jgi:hypothetical protein